MCISATLANSVTKHLTFFSAKLISAKHICEQGDLKMLPIWHAFPTQFVLKLVHSLFNWKTEGMCLRTQFTTYFFTHWTNNFILFFAKTSHRSRVITFGLVCLFFQQMGDVYSASYTFLVRKENHIQVLGIQNSHCQAGSYLWREDYLNSYMYFFHILSFVKQLSVHNTISSLTPPPALPSQWTTSL